MSAIAKRPLGFLEFFFGIFRISKVDPYLRFCLRIWVDRSKVAQRIKRLDLCYPIY